MVFIDKQKLKKICEDFGGKFVNENLCMVDGYPMALEDATYLFNYNEYSQIRKAVTPEKFLSLAPDISFNEGIISDLEEKIERKQPLDPLFVDIDIHGNILDHEGRHRAEASRRIGVNKVPVIFYCRGSDGSFVNADRCKKVVERL